MSDSASRGRYTRILPGASSPHAEEDMAVFDTVPAGATAPLSSEYSPNSEGSTCPESPQPSEITQNHSRPDTVEGSSSHLASVQNLHPSAAGLPSDLENQDARHSRLSAAARVKNVVTYLFPFKQTYERLHNGVNIGRLQSNAPGRFVGQGTDGVFRNLMAKPDTETSRAAQEQHPPTYEEAAADSSPEYWEATMLSPMYEDEVFVHGLPVGNLANFVWNVLVTVAFQLVGFVLCYLLHTSHAAKQGTRAGLGITIVMYGSSVIPANHGRGDRVPPRYEPSDANSIDISKSSSIKTGGAIDTYSSGFVQNSATTGAVGAAQTPLVAYAIIAFGILVFLKSFVDFYNVKREERRIMAPQASEETHSTTESVEHPPPS